MRSQKLLKTILSIVVIFWGLSAVAQPDWSVIPNDFVYSMTITGKISTDGTFSNDPNDIIAAFINGECRGVTNVKNVGGVGDLVFLMIYSNEPTGTITFKMYDADASGEKELNVKETINFVVNDIVGSVSSPFIFSSSNLNNEAKLLTFTIPNQEGTTHFDGNNVYLMQHWSGDLAGITPNFTISDGAKAYVNGVLQESGVSTHNFQTPVEYTIESADHSASTIYTVHLTLANDIPTDILLDENRHEENRDFTFIGNFEAITENPEETHVFSLVTEVDTENEHFQITGDGLRARHPFNYEEQAEYRIKVRADDLKGGVIEKYFIIEIIDQNDPPTNVALLNTNTPVNVAAGSRVGDFMAIDEDAGDTHTFSLISGDGSNDKDNSKFQIEGNQLVSKVVLSFLEDSEYRIYVEGKDAEGSTVKVPILINTQDQGNPPHDLTLTNTLVIGIDVPPVFVGTLEAKDADQQTGHTFNLPENNNFGPDNSHFIVLNDALYLNTPLPVNEKSSYEIFATATDSMGNQFNRAFIISVKEKLSEGGFFLTNSQIPENQPFNSIVGYFDSEKYESSECTFKLPLEVDLAKYSNNRLKLNGRTLLTNEVFDFESENSLMLQVEVSDGTSRIRQEVSLNVTNQNDPPTAISLSTQILSESAEENSVVATLSATDQDVGDSHTFSLVIGNGINDVGNNHFKINDNNLVLSKALNFEEKEFFNILLRATDNSGASFEQGLRLQVVNANDAPEFLSTPENYILEDQVYVYSIEVEDSENDDVTISFKDLPGWLAYNQLSNLITGVPGNDWVGVYTFEIIASDGKKESVQSVLITVINVNDPPEINYYLSKQQFFANHDNNVQLPSDCIIDPDAGDKLTCTISQENNSAPPNWLSFNAETMILTGKPPDEACGTYQLKLTATDKGKLKEWIVFELEVTYPTPVEDLLINDLFKIYPNPVQNQLKIKISNGEKVLIEIRNLAGQLVQTEELWGSGEHAISFKEVPGFYYIHLKQGKKEFIQKITKM